MKHLSLAASLLAAMALLAPVPGQGQTLPAPTLRGDNIRTTATDSTTARTLAARAADVLNLMDYGAACDDTTDDSAAISAAILTGRPISIPVGRVCKASSISYLSLSGTFVGPGRVRTSDGNLRGPLFTGWAAAPGAGNFSSAGTAWNGNLSGTWAHEHLITGAATLGQPSSGYQQTPDTSGQFLYTHNRSGHNESASGNGGRTGTAGHYTKLDQYGQGDLTAYFCSGIVASTRSGAEHYLASPQVSCLGGDMWAGAAGAYLQGIGDLNLRDNGFDVAGVGIMMNFERSVATEGLSSSWIGDIRAASGTQPLDIAYRVTGPIVHGFDLSSATIGHYRLASATLGSAGSGYTVGDVLTVSGGTSVTPTKFVVSTVNGGGGVTAIAPVNTGLYTAPPVTTYTTLTVTGGTGTGVSISGFYDLGAAMLLPTAGGCIRPAESQGSPVTNYSGYYGSLCLTRGALAWGDRNSITGGAANPGSSNVALGSHNQLLGRGNVVLGSGVYDIAAYGALFFGNGTFSGEGAGKAQTSLRLLRGVTGANTTPIRLTTDQAAAGANNSYHVLAGSAHSLNIRVTAINMSNGDSAAWVNRNGLLTRTSAGSAAYTGAMSSAAAPDHSTGAGSGATVTVSADTTNQALNVTFTPPAGNSAVWRVIARIDADQVQ